MLVIAGITASFAVPALTGYIDNAKEKQAVSETQACVMTATRIAAQKYAEWQKNTTYQLAGGNELTSSAEFQPLVGCTGTTSNTPARRDRRRCCTDRGQRAVSAACQ